MQINGFDNTLDKINLSHKDIEKQICLYSLSFSQTRRNDIEWKMRLPMFVPSFYLFIRNRNIIPSQQEYWQSYVSDNENFFSNSKFSLDQMEGLRARIFRTYPSLVRDVHLGMTLKYDNDLDEVFYNETIDIEYGVDLVIKKSEKLLGLNLFTNTNIAIQARIIKEYRPKKPLSFKCIELPINFKDSKYCGKFFLYSDREIEQIKREILINV